MSDYLWKQACFWQKLSPAHESGELDMRTCLSSLLAFLLVAAAPPAEVQQWLERGEAERAFALAETAAAAGDPAAMAALGWLYESGIGVAPDLTRAAELYRRAAEAGDSEGQWRLGSMLAYGEGVPANPEEAAAWFRRSAEGGEAMGSVGLAALYALGRGVPLDYRQAYHYYLEGARRGEPHGVYGIGVLHQHGQGVPENPWEGLAWYMAAAALGFPEAEQLVATTRVSPAEERAAAARADAILRELGLDAAAQ